MKSFLIIGMGKFGHHLCNYLSELNNEIMVIDELAEKVEDVVDIVTSAKIGDCTKTDVLKTLGVETFDTCFVCISDNFQNSLEITYNLYEMGAKQIIALASTDIHSKFLLRNGANKVIYPERDMANKLSKSISNDNIFDYLELGEEYSIMEIKCPKFWLNKTAVDLNIRAKYNINIIAIKKENGKIKMPGIDYKFCEQDHLIVMGKYNDIKKILI